MTRHIVVIVSLVWALGQSTITTTAKDHIPRVFDSVKPLQWLDEMGVPHNHCTTWSIAEQGVWMTAGHCVLRHPDDDEGDQTPQPALDRDYRIADQPARIAIIDIGHDLALLIGQGAPALVLSDRDVRFSDEISVAGHPLGETRPVIFYGRIAAIQTDGDWMGLDVTACGGNSGSPVLNKRGEVVSVLQVGVGRPCGHYSGGVMQDVLRAFVAKWVPHPHPESTLPPFQIGPKAR